MILYDIHTHSLKDDRQDTEVRYILNTSPVNFTSEKEKEIHNVWFSCGIHPWDADNTSSLDLLSGYVKDERVVAIGEAGLDKLKGPPIKTQIEIFRSQIELAVQEQKPLIIHCVKAWDELIALYKEYKTDLPWILHGFRGNSEQTKQLATLGFKFSIGEHFNKEAVTHIPLDSLFCETDMSDVSISNVYEALSLDLQIDIDLFVSEIDNNIRKYFKFVSE
ncbi:MAG: TatD family hydrolase [Prevotella sp.]|jgi:TatD DNase family protein|nr:TatD family hydrolase [Prevotella sp.]